MVELAAAGGPAAQKLPNPWVASTIVASGSTEASRRAEVCWAAASSPVCAAPDRSGRPVDPFSRHPPVKTAATSPVAASVSTYDRWVKV
jgi:hypothetical protein